MWIFRSVYRVYNMGFDWVPPLSTIWYRYHSPPVGQTFTWWWTGEMWIPCWALWSTSKNLQLYFGSGKNTNYRQINQICHIIHAWYIYIFLPTWMVDFYGNFVGKYTNIYQSHGCCYTGTATYPRAPSRFTTFCLRILLGPAENCKVSWSEAQVAPEAPVPREAPASASWFAAPVPREAPASASWFAAPVPREAPVPGAAASCWYKMVQHQSYK